MKFSAEAKGETLELNFFGMVGDDWDPEGISYKRVSKALRDHPNAKTIKIQANSFGGAAFEGHAIRSLLQASGRRVEMQIHGVAASAMTVISTAADHIAMASDAQFMIHRSAGFAMGNADQIKADVQALENLDDAMVYVYAARTKQSQRQIREWMEAETWFSAKEALAHGFVDEIVPPKGIKAKADGRLSFKSLPQMYTEHLQQLPVSTTVAKKMDLNDIKQLLDGALAPIAARLEKLEAPAPAVAPEPEPEIEIEPAASPAEAEMKAMFAEAVNARFEAFVSQGKLVPAAREKFVAACSTPAALKAVCELYASAPAAVATGGLQLPAVKPTDAKVYSAQASEWAERAKIDLKKLNGTAK